MITVIMTQVYIGPFSVSTGWETITDGNRGELVQRVLQLDHHVGYGLKPGLPERLGRHIDSNLLQNVPRRLGSSGGQYIDVARDEIGPLVLIHAIQSEYQQVPEAIGIAIEWAGEYVGNRQPFPLEFARDAHAFPKLLLERGQITLGQIRDRRTVRNHLMCALFKQDKISLPHDRRMDIVEV